MLKAGIRVTLLLPCWVALMVSPYLAESQSKPSHLTCESLTTPLGMDEPHPGLSWQLEDPRHGAAQTAYQIQVAASLLLLNSGKPDVWDSGQIKSNQSVDVRYSGPALAAYKRYYWRVKVWDRDGKPYPPSDATWWETGLLNPENWQAKWISYEDDEHRSVRDANAEWITTSNSTSAPGEKETHLYFRFKFDLPADARVAKLHITGKDTVAAWVNGKQKSQLQAWPKWNNLPWRTYSIYDITREVHSGSNTLAADVLNYDNGRASATLLSATIFVQMADGKVITYKTGLDGWKCSATAANAWTAPEFDDSSWQAASTSSEKTGLRSEVAGNPWAPGPVVSLRKRFDVSKPITSARLYATALGAYKFHINGKVVGEQILSPGWMDFRHHVPYQAYDVTALLQSGRNAMAALLAPGWYSTPLTWVAQANNYGTAPPSLRAQLRIEHSDGSVDWINTDETWRADNSATTSAEIYNGETYDARLVQSGWDTANFTDSPWHDVQLPTISDIAIEWQSFPPIRIEKELTAKSMATPKPGTYVFDFGQNLAGVARIHAQGAAGTTVQLRFAELANSDGTIYTENLRNAQATDRIILSGKGVEEFQPNFTFHGFRYVEVTGLPEKPALDSLKVEVFHTDAPLTAKLRTGSKMLNQLWSNILWGQRSNFVGVPTDCPQRDERLGWTGDAQVFWRAAVFNMGIDAFSRKFAGDLRGTQTPETPMYAHFAPGVFSENDGFAPGWADAGVIIPWTAWVQFGDKRILEQNWDAMQKYLGAIETANPDYLWRKNTGIHYGDWLSPEGVTAEDILATAYWAYDTSLMAQMAQALGRTDDEQHYRDNFEKIKTAFIKAYVHDDGSVTPNEASFAAIPAPGDPAGRILHESQTGYVLAIHMNLLPEELRAKAADHLLKLLEANQWRLGTGFLGTPYLLAALTETGHSDVAYRILLNTAYPSWGYLVEHGATTMWERWNGDEKKSDPSMNSYNHYAYGAVADWIYRYAAGIDTTSAAPGFNTIYLHPSFSAALGQIDLSYDSPYGRIHSAWKVNGKSAVWNLTIPPNSVAELPLKTGEAERYLLNGKALGKTTDVGPTGKGGEQDVYHLTAGTYTITVRLN
ncbi:MAG TPA: family 78 glycoside hydrolase catalytic domain [Terriglobales bacterium]|nr:family 78 glycoside hydrolase catalytic domain [Terriglobales bacterium]